MSNKNKIKVGTIISNVIRDLQLKEVNHLVDYIIEWAYEAELFIGSYDTFKRNECELTVKNKQVKLPKDFYQFIALKIGDTYPEVTNRDFRFFNNTSPNLAGDNTNMFSMDASRQTAFGYDGTEMKTFKMSIDNGYINLSGIPDGTKVGIAYLSFELDEDGFPLIRESHQMAVTAYIVWKIKLSEYINGEISHHVYAELEKRWHWLCGQARGEDEMPDPKQLEYIASIYHQLLPLPNKNFF